MGHFIHTYQSDGDPLPSFQGEPRLVELSALTSDDLADEIWDSLNEDNKVSLYVWIKDLKDQDNWNSLIINKHR